MDNTSNVENIQSILDVKECTHNIFENGEVISISKLDLFDLGNISNSLIEMIENNKDIVDTGMKCIDFTGKTIQHYIWKNTSICGRLSAITGIGKEMVAPTLIINPGALALTITLSMIKMKLDDISNMVDKILEHIELNDRSELMAANDTLTEMIYEYKHRYERDDQIASDLQVIRNYKELAKAKQYKYKELIEKLIKSKRIKIDTNKDFQTLQKYFTMYQMALYILGIATYLQIIYDKNYSSEYLTGKIEYLKKYYDEMNKLFAESSEYINKEFDKSVLETAKRTGLVVLNGINKIPNITKAGIIGTGVSKIAKFGGKALEKDISNKKEDISKRIENMNNLDLIKIIDKIKQLDLCFNKPLEIYVDNNGIYLKSKIA